MLAEAVHSVADTGNEALLLVGRNRAEQAPDTLHPFGYSRNRYFYSFVVALVLFLMGCLFAINEAIHKIRFPEEIESPWVAIGILGVSMLLEGSSFRTARKQSVPLKGKHSWWHFIRNTRNPELPVVLLEDAGAIIDLLIGEGATAKDDTAIRSALLADPRIERVIRMQSQYLGPQDLLINAEIALRPGLDVTRVSEVIDAADARIRAAVPNTCTIYLEPDVFEPDKVHDAPVKPR